MLFIIKPCDFGFMLTSATFDRSCDRENRHQPQFQVHGRVVSAVDTFVNCFIAIVADVLCIFYLASQRIWSKGFCEGTFARFYATFLHHMNSVSQFTMRDTVPYYFYRVDEVYFHFFDYKFTNLKTSVKIFLSKIVEDFGSCSLLSVSMKET